MAPQAPAPNAGPPAPDPPPIPGPLCRFVLDDVLPEADCRELIYAHRCAGVPGHVPGLSATLPQDLVAAGAEGLLVPLLRARQRVREALEAALGLHWALHFEFTALMGWAPGAFLGDHYDRNRPYLLPRLCPPRAPSQGPGPQSARKGVRPVAMAVGGYWGLGVKKKLPFLLVVAYSRFHLWGAGVHTILGEGGVHFL